jgi:glycosyltransferase involved in cell wall biosynthesis
MVVASAYMRAEYLAHGVAPDRLQAIPLFAAPSSANSAAGAPVDVLFLGRMTNLKGPSLLLKALRATASTLGRRVSVVMAGDGPLRDALRRTAATLPGVDAAFPGWVDERGRAELFGRVALLAVPSVWPEPFGLVGLEAAAFGIPSVAFDVGGIREWLADGENGRLISAGDTAAMGAAIAALLQDPLERTRLGVGARATWARLSPDAHLSRLEAVLDRAQHP